MNREGRPRKLPSEADLKSLLEGSGMHRPLAAVLRQLGLTPLSWAHLRSHHRPGAGITALYRVQAQPRRAAAAGQPGQTVHLQIGATTAALPPETMTGEPAATLSATLDGTAIRLWVHPRDPVLAGLPWATNAEAVARDVFAGTGTASLALTAYRPLRRAVVRADYAGARAYLKVPQPKLAAGLRHRLELAADAGLPVPPLLDAGPAAGSARENVLVLESLPGKSLHLQLRPADAPAFDPDALVDLLDRLPAAAMAFSRRPGWAERVVEYADGAVVALGAESARISHLARDIAAAVAAADPGPLVPSHGDFHGGNLLAVGNGETLEISGLLDVDALGPGYRVDDLACFLGHLRVLSVLHPQNSALRAAAQLCTRSFARQTDPEALYARSAAVALTLVAGASSRGRQAAELTLATAEELLGCTRTGSG